MDNSSLKTIMQITKALADVQRVRALMLLSEGELCVCQIIAVLDLAPSTVSKHLAILKSANLIECRKDSTWVFYRLPAKFADTEIRSALNWLRKSLMHDKQILKDRKVLNRVLKCDPTVLCQQQREKTNADGRR